MCKIDDVAIGSSQGDSLESESPAITMKGIAHRRVLGSESETVLQGGDSDFLSRGFGFGFDTGFGFGD